MNVRELRHRLFELDQDAEVIIVDEDVEEPNDRLEVNTVGSLLRGRHNEVYIFAQHLTS